MPGIMLNPPKHIDVSRWIVGINWECMRLNGLKWAGMRATVSNYYVDPTYKFNAARAGANGIMRPPYLVPRADATILGTLNTPKIQMDLFSKTIDGLHDGVVIQDVEVATSYPDANGNVVTLPKQQVTDVNMACWEIAKQRYDHVIWYSRASFMDGFMAYDRRFKDLYLFLAEYGPDDGRQYPLTLIPRGCTRDQIVLHQVTSKGNPFCCDKIVNALDYDVVVNQDLFNKIHKLVDEPEPIDNPVIDPAVLARLKTVEDQFKNVDAELEALSVSVNASLKELQDRLKNAKIII